MRPVVTLIVVLFLGTASAVAQETQSRLDRIQADVQKTDTEIQQLSARENELDGKVAKLVIEVDALRAQERKLAKELESIGVSLGLAERDVQRSESKLKELQGLWLRRLRVLYMYERDEVLELLLTRTQGRGIDIPPIFLTRIRQADDDLIRRLLAGKADAEQKRALLLKAEEDQARVQREIAKQRESLAGSVKEQRTLMAALKSEREVKEGLLTGLRAQALRLETVMSSITGGEDEPESKGRRRNSDAEDVVQPFKGPGLFAQKGSLTVPVSGKLLQRFGKQRVAEFADVIFGKGLEFQVEAGKEVSAVAEGKAIFVGRTPGYGTVVILDHGSRYYSLYGRVRDPEVDVGDVVDKGDTLATVGEPDQQGRNFYFEIRHNGAPINPQQFFRSGALGGR